MHKILIIAIGLLCCCSASAQNYPNPKDLYRLNCKAVVQIQAGKSVGVGFIFTPGGTILTANHVVTTEESGFRKYATSIKVQVALSDGSGSVRTYDATPVSKVVSDDQVNFDTAAIQIQATSVPGGLAGLDLGDWKTVEVGDQVTILTKSPGTGCLLSNGTVAAKSSYETPLGPKSVDTLIFQAPASTIFSGSPIINSRGEVIAIETASVFGISPTLAELESRWHQSKDVDPAATNIELTNGFDQNLIGGIGSGVSIEYGKDQTRVVIQRELPVGGGYRPHRP